jgi:hypothetical protein
MLALLMATWFTPADASVAFTHTCPPMCGSQILHMESVIEPGELVSEDRRVGGLQSLEIVVHEITGRMEITVNGYVLGSRYLVSDIRGIQTYRVPVRVTDTVGVQIDNMGTDPIEYEIDIQGSNQAPPAP